MAQNNPNFASWGCFGNGSAILIRANCNLYPLPNLIDPYSLQVHYRKVHHYTDENMPAIKVAAVPSAEEHLQNIAATSETLNESYDCEKDLIMDLSDMDNDNEKV